METIKTTKYLVFIKEDRPENKKTDTVIVSNIHHNQTIGHIKWYGKWRQYCFFPEGDTIWNTDCLNEINNVILGLMDDRKALPPSNKKIVGVIAQSGIDFHLWLNAYKEHSFENEYISVTKPSDCDGYRFNEVVQTDMAIYNSNYNTIRNRIRVYPMSKK